MNTIFVMVKCELGSAYTVADRVTTQIEEVSEVYSISGQYDLLLKCFLPQTIDIGRFVTEQLQAIAGIKDTFTIITFRPFSRNSAPRAPDSIMATK